jgi:hypothetical protein
VLDSASRALRDTERKA